MNPSRCGCKEVSVRHTFAGVSFPRIPAAPGTFRICQEAVGRRSALRANVRCLVCFSLLLGSQASPGLSLRGPICRMGEE